MTDLGTLGGATGSGLGINNAGQVTGHSTTSTGEDHVFLYANGRMADLGTLGGTTSEGLGINNLGQVTGWAATRTGGFHAFLYHNAQMQDLGTVSGYTDTFGYALNNLGEVVGVVVNSAGDDRAMLYRNGEMADLNNLIDPALGIILTDADGINDQGQIVANSESRAYLLTPVPEPSTLALFIAAVLGLGAGVRRKIDLMQ